MTPDLIHPPDCTSCVPEIVLQHDAVEHGVGPARMLPAWLVSVLMHGFLIVLIGWFHVPALSRHAERVIRLLPEEPERELVLEEIDFRRLEVGDESGGSEINVEITMSEPKVMIGDRMPTRLPSDMSFAATEDARMSLSLATGEDFARRYQIKGTIGVGTTSASPAIDRLTREILLHLEERPTLVVWLLDQSASMMPQRAEIYRRLDRIYRELGAVQASGRFARYEDQPLLSSVVAFGKDIDLKLPNPTSDVDEIRRAVASIERDDSGVERVFGAILLAVDKFKKFRRSSGPSSTPLRNVMFIVMTDEAGDDQQLLEDAAVACARLAIPVHVIGVPAPFGQSETLIKWVDPDPRYDQSPQWGRVMQGPETAAVERIRVGVAMDPRHQVPIESGFGPYALTRIAYETGGIYFSVHADRDRTRAAAPHEVQAYSSHFEKFFDPSIMAAYRPDYVTQAGYQRLLRVNAVREGLVGAAAESWISPLDEPNVQFLVQSEAQFASELTEAQKLAAVRSPMLRSLQRRLIQAEPARPKETELRWQAGYDLAVGQTLAALVRNETYNAMLAQAKRGLTWSAPQHNTWTLRPSRDVSVDREMQRLAEKALEYLHRVVDQHAGTPWSYLAERELESPLGWQWVDSYRMPPEERRRQEAERRQFTPRDDRVRSVPKPPTREMPRL